MHVLGSYQFTPNTCPSCGYCPHCGRGGHSYSTFGMPQQGLQNMQQSQPIQATNQQMQDKYSALAQQQDANQQGLGNYASIQSQLENRQGH